MNVLFLDIETVADPAKIGLLPEPTAPANYKDEQKIKEYVEQKKKDQVAKIALDPDYAAVRSIGWAFDSDKVIVRTSDGCQSPLEYERLWNITKDICAPAVIVGWNLLGFDIPFLMRRCMYHGIPWPTWLCNLRRYQTRPYLDLMQVYSNWGAFPYISLKQAAKLHGIEIPAGDKDGSMVATMTEQELIEYQKSDIIITRELYHKMKGIYF